MKIKINALSKENYELTDDNEWLDCLFDSEGELFFVELKKQKNETARDFVNRCLEIAVDNFGEEELTFDGIYSAEYAESLGFDTY